MRACVICARGIPDGRGMSDDRHREHCAHDEQTKEGILDDATDARDVVLHQETARAGDFVGGALGTAGGGDCAGEKERERCDGGCLLALGPSSPAGSFDAGLDAAAAAAAVAVADAFVSAGTMVSTASGAGAVSAVAMLAPGSPSAEQGGRGLPSRRERCLGRAPLGRRSGTPPADARAVVAVLPAGRERAHGSARGDAARRPRCGPSPRPPSHSARTPSPPSRRYARTDGTTTARRDDASRRVSLGFGVARPATRAPRGVVTASASPARPPSARAPPSAATVVARPGGRYRDAAL